MIGVNIWGNQLFGKNSFFLSQFIFVSNPNNNEMEIRKSMPSELRRVKKFYKKYGCQWNINSRDYILIAEKKDKIKGVIRINEENGYPILMGVLVDEVYRRQGIAKKMLNEAEQYLQAKETYCITYVHLKRFYKQFGYEAMEFKKAPVFLKEALLFNNKPRKYSKIGMVIIMRKWNTD